MERRNQSEIVYVLTDYHPSTGGTSTAARAAARELVARGWKVTVLTRRLSRAWKRVEVLDGVTIHRVGRPGHSRVAKMSDLFATWWWLIRSGRRIGVVQAFMDPDYALAALAAGLRNRTVMRWATRGDPERFLRGRILGRMRVRLLRRTLHVALTPAMGQELIACGLPPASIIPVPTDSARFRPASLLERTEARNQIGITADATIIFTGHLEPRKGIDQLLVAFATLVAGGYSTHLLVVGGSHGHATDLGPVLHQFVRERSLDTCVTFTGVVADVAPYLRASDVFCLPSQREGMSNSLVEAMACGLACVAPVSAGGDELLGDGAGVIPASNTPADLVAALSPLLADPDYREHLGRAATERARSLDLQSVVDAYQDLYTPLLGVPILHSTPPHESPP
ncbi:MAG: glycosyltransferase family 4 protein [Candidatus Dormibacteria bacterium]